MLLPIIIDADPGVDDALALIMAFENKNLDIKLMTTVAGNVNLEHTTNNAIFLREKFGYKFPIVKGANKPIKKTYIDASDVHGEGGLGKFKYPTLNISADGNCAEDAIYDTLCKSEQKLTIVGLGPVTNLANLFLKYPDAKDKIEKIYLMIGSTKGEGNITNFAEYNAFCDPDAMQVLLDLHLPIIFSPMELGHETFIKKSIFTERVCNTERETMIKQMIEGSFDSIGEGSGLFGLHDPNTILLLTNPELYNLTKCNATIDCSEEKSGQMFIVPDENGKYLLQTIKNVQDILDCFLEKIYK